MVDYLVTLDSTVNFAPKTEVEEILQNVRTILATRLGTVPLHRGFGVTWEHIDKPLHVAKMLTQILFCGYPRQQRCSTVTCNRTNDNSRYPDIKVHRAAVAQHTRRRRCHLPQQHYP